jgi:hypothetical protein
MIKYYKGSSFEKRIGMPSRWYSYVMMHNFDTNITKMVKWYDDEPNNKSINEFEPYKPVYYDDDNFESTETEFNTALNLCN